MTERNYIPGAKESSMYTVLVPWESDEAPITPMPFDSWHSDDS